MDRQESKNTPNARALAGDGCPPYWPLAQRRRVCCTAHQKHSSKRLHMVWIDLTYTAWGDYAEGDVHGTVVKNEAAQQGGTQALCRMQKIEAQERSLSVEERQDALHSCRRLVLGSERRAPPDQPHCRRARQSAKVRKRLASGLAAGEQRQLQTSSSAAPRSTRSSCVLLLLVK